MKKLTYSQAYNKIIDAYFKDEIKPFKEQFCFCGTLSPNANWSNSHLLDVRIHKHYPYSVDEYGRMEEALFSRMPKTRWRGVGWVWKKHERHEDNYTEDELFNGMCAALEVLKEIHRERGENVDTEATPFVKRNLHQKLISHV